MSVNFNFKSGTCGSQSSCADEFGCPSDRCPDFIIRRHDTKPVFKVYVEDCDGPLDIQGLIVEVSMWAKARLKAAITTTSTYFGLADNVGFNQVMVGDIIAMDRVRLPEYMLVTGFDEENKLIQVERGYRDTTPVAWKKGQKMRIFRVLNAPAQTEMVFEDIDSIDGTVEEDSLTEAYLVYEWQPEDTCLPGCYWFEFKLMKMQGVVLYLPGGHWVGETHEYSDGFYYTGTTHTDSSVKLSYDSVNDKYVLPSIVWSGETHQEDEVYFTGTSEDDGSVILSRTGVPSDPDTAYNEDGSLGILSTSITPSFTDISLTPADFGCILGEGVEWARRFPVSGEGFLIKINDSPTSESLL